MYLVRFSMQSAVYMFFVASVAGRGRLVDPPNRSSLWREGYLQLINRNDSDLNCGGDMLPYLPFQLNGGWCGVCGDSIFEPRNHELGGLYVPQFTISRRYSANSKYIDAAVLVEEFLGGFFEFSLCAHNEKNEKVHQECLDENRLRIYGYGTRYFPLRAGLHRLRLEIPVGLVCEHCVLQWRWITEQYTHTDCRLLPHRRHCFQWMQYINCADISIMPSINPRFFNVYH